MYGFITSIASRILLANVFDHMGRRFFDNIRNINMIVIHASFYVPRQAFEVSQTLSRWNPNILNVFKPLSFYLLSPSDWHSNNSESVRIPFCCVMFTQRSVMTGRFQIQYNTEQVCPRGRSFNYAFHICTPNTKAHNCYRPAPSSTRIDAQTVKCRFPNCFLS